jgi:hypothetical protein
VVQVHVPTFLSRQVFTNPVPALNWVPSGMVTSVTNWAASQNPLAEAEKAGLPTPKLNMASETINEKSETVFRRTGMPSS